MYVRIWVLYQDPARADMRLVTNLDDAGLFIEFLSTEKHPLHDCTADSPNFYASWTAAPDTATTTSRTSWLLPAAPHGATKTDLQSTQPVSQSA
jgi:hypothetical protein